MSNVRIFNSVLGVAVGVFLFTGCDGGTAKKLQAENDALRAEVEALRAHASTPEAEAARDAELKRLQKDAGDAARLRGEVTQLRNATKDTEKLRGENQQLRDENQKLRGAVTSATAVPPPPPAPAPAVPNTFPRESWTFAGYTSPEAALVSAIYSMQQGNPKQYFESLTPEEQARMTKVWEGKSAEEIAAKHQNDTAKITGMRVLNSTPIADDQVLMNVFIEGVNRPEQVRMRKVGNDWKFGGFMREPKQ
jgi:cell division protein FtsB